MSDPLDAARQLIESRLSEIRDEVSKLERAVAHLGERDAATPRPRRPRRKGTGTSSSAPARPKRRVPKSVVAKRAPRGRRREELMAAIKANPGARPSELAASMGIRPTQVSVLIARARSEKLIVKSGKGYALKS